MDFNVLNFRFQKVTNYSNTFSCEKSFKNKIFILLQLYCQIFQFSKGY